MIIILYRTAKHWDLNAEGSANLNLRIEYFGDCPLNVSLQFFRIQNIFGVCDLWTVMSD